MQRESAYVGVEILVVDEDPNVQNGMKSLLEESGFMITIQPDIEEAIDLIRRKFFAVVLCDLDSPHTEEGLKVVEAINELSPATSSIVLSPRKAFGAAVAAFRGGATDVVVKEPGTVSYLKERVIKAAVEWKRKRDRDELLLQMSDVHDDFLVRMREMFKSVVDMQDRLQGRDVMSSFQLPECRVLVVDDDEALYNAITTAFQDRDDGWHFSQVRSGGEALDIGGREKFHLAIIKEMLPDLPGSMVQSTLRAQSPETIYLQCGTPGNPGAKVTVTGAEKDVSLIDEFKEPAQLAGRLDEIRDAFGAKAKERRYIQSFRTAQYDFLKQYADLQKSVDAAKDEMKARQKG